MRFVATRIPGLYVIELEPVCDERGSFTRSWCRREFEEQGLQSDFVQCNRSYNARRGTLRGMHYQAAPHQEAKVVSVIRGTIHDVVIDLRPDSGTFCKHFAIDLKATNPQSLYIPEGCAHGFLTLEDETEVSYQMSDYYVPDAACGVRWNDPAFGINWPIAVSSISKRDASYPDFRTPIRCAS